MSPSFAKISLLGHSGLGLSGKSPMSLNGITATQYFAEPGILSFDILNENKGILTFLNKIIVGYI